MNKNERIWSKNKKKAKNFNGMFIFSSSVVVPDSVPHKWIIGDIDAFIMSFFCVRDLSKFIITYLYFSITASLAVIFLMLYWSIVLGLYHQKVTGTKCIRIKEKKYKDGWMNEKEEEEANTFLTRWNFLSNLINSIRKKSPLFDHLVIIDC